MRQMRTLLLLVSVLLAAGCIGGTPVPPTALPTIVPTTAVPPTITPTPSPVGTLTPTPTIPPPTPVPLLPGYGQFEPDVPFAIEVRPDLLAERVFTLSALTAYTVTISPVNADLDVRISLLDPTGNPLISVDRSGPGAAEQVREISLPISGDYTLRMETVSGAGQVTGAFTSLEPEQMTGGGRFDPLIEAADLTTTGTFQAPDVVHAYIVDLTGSNAVYFEMTVDNPGLDLTFTIYDPNYSPLGTYRTEGAAAARSADMYIPFDGSYIVVVHNLNDGTGTYTLRVLEE